MTLGADYFAGLYAVAVDPWGFRDRWYELRKRDVTVAALTRPRYTRAFEPGCSIGMLSAALAARCEQLIVADIDERAVATARADLAALRHVEVMQLDVLREWPDGSFDLVVLSEICYYLEAHDLDLLLDRVVAGLDADGTVLACHWRHPVADYPLSGDEVHRRVLGRSELCSAVHHVEEDFVVDLLTRRAVASPARREGLTP